MSHTPGATFNQTFINVQGGDQEALEVYADETKAQTIGFVFEEKYAHLLAAAEGMRVLILRNLARLETGKVNLDEFTWIKDARALLKQLEDS